MSAWSVRVGGVLEVILQCRSKHADRPENAPKICISKPNNEIFLFGGAPPFPRPYHTPSLHPIYSGRLRRLYPCAFGARLGPLQTLVLDPVLVGGVNVGSHMASDVP